MPAQRSGNTSRMVVVRSDKDTHFTGSLATNAGELESLSLSSGNTNPRTNEFIIESVAVLSDQNLEWDLYIWGASGADDTDHDVDTFIDYENFAVASGKQIAGAGLFRYASGGLSIPYRDDSVDEKGGDPDATMPRVHCTLVNRDGTAKNAGATGEVVVIISMRPVNEM